MTPSYLRLVADLILPDELRVGQPSPAKVIPQSLLGRGLVATKLTRAFGQTSHVCLPRLDLS